MLVLSRKKGEAIFIGKDVEVEVLGIEGDRVRIGIQAPKDVRIYRKELMEETASINKVAVSVPISSLSFKKKD